MTFKVGDIVQLKSGSPKMTVASEVSRDQVWASWFAGAKHEKASFHIDALEAAPTSPPAPPSAPAVAKK